VSAEDVVASCEARLRPLEIAANNAWWDANVHASDDTRRRREAADVALSDALADRDAFAAVESARASRPADALLDRQLTLLEHEHLPHQVPDDLRRAIVALQADIESRFASHRGEIFGESVDDNAIRAVLQDSDDVVHRRAAWEASKSVGAEVADDLRRLVELRNEAARALGARDHFALALTTTEYDETRLFSTLAEVDRLTATPFAAMKATLDDRLAERFGSDASQLRPWHYEDPFFQDGPRALGVDLDPLLESHDLDALTARTFAGMDLDIATTMQRSDLLPRDGKVQHAFCVDIDRAGDVRVLSNNAPGEYWAQTMLHEFGHAVYFDGFGAALPWLLRTMHLCVTEGVAMLCGRLVHDPLWLQDVAGVPAETVDGIAPKLAAQRRAALLVFARWVLVMTHFERGLYADPAADHDERWWDLVERYQLVRRPDARHAPDWAAKIHIALAPVYYHNYLFGELIASQLAAAAGTLVDHADAGRFLTARVFAPGASLRWDTLIEQATGAPLSPVAFARDLVA
jgi:peptidyl-dipeptidase A